MVKEVANHEFLKAKWSNLPWSLDILVTFKPKKYPLTTPISGKMKMLIPKEKIASGKYSVSMVKHNILLKLNRWFKEMYAEYQDQMSKID